MTIELFNNGQHLCLMFDDLVDDTSNVAVQSNQFLIVDHGHGALLEPGGNMTYNALVAEMGNYFLPKHLQYILASHADPDIIASVNKWMIHSDCKVLISRLWVRFVPHFCSVGNADGRIEGIPDRGMDIPLGDCMIKAVPAHFMHSEGNFQFYDPVSRILFTGDMAASIVPHKEADTPVEDFQSHIPLMEEFHRRYMVSSKICRYWANMVRQLDVETIVPQHGRILKGRKVVAEFLDWIENLPCGVDLLTQDDYRLP
ncbi:MAG: FprA family A-type flavoprotein [Nitrosomonadales bacterium]|nr:FprA family A-type flavoprotein [Nitrosomonadales bacterium]